MRKEIPFLIRTLQGSRTSPFLSSILLLRRRCVSFVGYAGYFGYVGYFGGSLEYGWGITAIMAERISLSFRPVNVELAGPGLGSPVELNYSLMGGLGTVW